MKTVIVKVNNATQTIAEHTVVTQDGKPTIIKASQKVNYELVDKVTGHAPNHIITKRVGNDLHVSMEDEGKDSDLIIEGFYDHPDSALIGLAENGEYYYYIPDTGEVVDYVTELQIGDIEGQALGGDSQVAPWWIGATDGGFNALPWLFGLAGVGIVGATSGGGSNSNDKPIRDTTAPSKPTLTPGTDDGSVKVDLPADAKAGDTVTVKGTNEAGQPVEATLTKQPDGTWKSDNDAFVPSTNATNPNSTTIPEAAIKDGTPVSAEAKDPSGNTNGPVTTTAGSDADDTAPTAPTVSASNDLEQGQAAAGDVVATASGSTDPDGDAVTYELDTASQENYAIDPATGEITLTQAGADKVNAGETLPSPVVNATDGTLDSTSTTGTVPNTVNEVNEAPTAPTVCTIPKLKAIEPHHIFY